MRDLSGNIRKRAAKDLKKIVLAEGEDIRVIKAAKTAVDEGFAKIILLGECDKIKELAEQEGLDYNAIEIINPEHDERLIEGGVAKLNEFATLSFFQKKEVRTLQIRTSGVKYKYEN